jgi:hypothetical protein
LNEFTQPNTKQSQCASEEQRRQERQQEISDKISKLKKEGRMNKGDVVSTEDSMMLEAEQFFNKESPLKSLRGKS